MPGAARPLAGQGGARRAGVAPCRTTRRSIHGEMGHDGYCYYCDGELLRNNNQHPGWDGISSEHPAVGRGPDAWSGWRWTWFKSITLSKQDWTSVETVSRELTGDGRREMDAC